MRRLHRGRSRKGNSLPPSNSGIAPRLVHSHETRHLVPAAIALLSALLVACSTTAPTRSEAQFKAEVTRTEYGIPHVVANDLGSLGFGIGYAYAQDNFCLLAEKINQLNGERSRHFGPDSHAHAGTGESVSSRDSDFFFRSQFSKQTLAEAYRRESPETAEMTRGYVAGVNRHLRETGIDRLPTACRSAAWVRPLTEEDLYLWYTAVASLAASQTQIEAIAGAQPPAAPQTSGLTRRSPSSGAHGDPPADGIGSNAWAFGREATTNGRGLLFGNPHWPWGNINQFYQAHLTIPGRFDVMGVTYGGMPVIVIGFNRSLAWSHTVATGNRAVVRELTLAADSPTAYMVDGERREMQRSTVTIGVRGADGIVREEARTLYTTEYGPILAGDTMPWTRTTAYAYTDVSLPNRRMMSQWMAIGRARNVSEVRMALATHLAIPWVNTIAADADGATLYADYSVKPYVTDEMTSACGGSEAARRATAGGMLTLDGSRAACNPLSDPSTPQPGILPPRLLPVLERTDYVANSNNTFWLTNTKAPITGLPLVNGRSGTSLTMRAQSGLRIIESRLAGTDSLSGNRFDAAAVQALVFGSAAHPELGNRNRAAEVSLDAVRTICADGDTVTLPDQRTVGVGEACRVLSSWDGRHATTSVGAHLFREFWAMATRIPMLWSVPFDAADPLNTPREPNVASREVRIALRQALGAAVARLDALGIAADRAWGNVHAHPLADRRIPIAGNSRDLLNMMIAGPLTQEGYGAIEHGASYVQIVGFDDKGPEAQAVLLFGQSTNPDSPFHYDQLQQLWVKQKWNRLPFERTDIERRAVAKVTIKE